MRPAAVRALAFALATCAALACAKVGPSPVVVVEVAWPGATAAEVERQLTLPTEAALAHMAGAGALVAVSREGGARLKLALVAGTDPRGALEEARARIAALRATLPPSSSAPVVSLADADALASLRFRARSDLAPRETTAALEEVARRVEAVPGVARVDVENGSWREVRVELDAARLAEHALTPAEVADAVARAATVDIGVLASAVVRAAPEVRIADVALVVDGVRTAPSREAPLDPAPALAVWKLPGAGLADVQRGVLGALGAAPLPQGLALGRERAPAVDRASIVVSPAAASAAAAGDAAAGDAAPLLELARALVAPARATAGVVDVTGPPQPVAGSTVSVDRERAAARGVDVAAIARALRFAEGELVVVRPDAPVRVRMDADVSSFTVRGRDGALVALVELVAVERGAWPAARERRDRAPAVSLCVTTRAPIDEVMRDLRAVVARDLATLPAGARVDVVQGCD